jgi:hypothetical protein
MFDWSMILSENRLPLSGIMLERRLLKRRSDAGIEAFDGGAERHDRAKNDDRDAGGDDRIFDRAGATLVAVETAKKRSSAIRGTRAENVSMAVLP